MYLKAGGSTLAAWFAGLLLDVNLPGDWQILCLRVLFPVLAMGLCILSELKKKSGVLKDPPAPYHGAGG